MPLFNGLGQGGPLGAIGNNRPARWNALKPQYDVALFGPSDDGFLHNLSQTSLLAQNSNGTTPVTADSDPIGWAKSPVASQRIATQATTSARPFWKTPNFARFDGSDDNWLTTFNPTAAMSILVKAKMPASLAATQVIVGGSIAAGTRCYIAIQSTGKFGAGIGNTPDTTTGVGDYRGATGVFGFTYDGTTLTDYANGASIFSGAVTGTTGTSPLRIGSANNGGTASNFFAGDLYNALAINRALTPAEVLNLSNYWMSQ